MTIAENKISTAVSLLVEACHPFRIILFGSQARNEATTDSDIDLIVIVDQLKDREAETMQLYRTLWDKKIYADVVLVTRDHFDYWKDTTNHVCNEALIDGKVLYEKAS